jgi:hypothetical protein
MASTGPAAILERLVDDDDVQQQLVAAGGRARDAYRRARRARGRTTGKDPTISAQLRGAAAAGIEAVRGLAGKPPPEPPPRRGRRALVLLGIAIAAAAFVFARRADQRRPRVDGVDAGPTPPQGG